MAIVAAIYWVYIASCLLYALAAQDTIAVRTVCAVFLASLVTSVISALEIDGFASFNFGILFVDLALMAYLLSNMLRSDRDWPIFAAGFHLNAIVTHAAILSDSSIVPFAYASGQGIWTWLVLAAALFGARTYALER